MDTAQGTAFLFEHNCLYAACKALHILFHILEDAKSLGGAADFTFVLFFFKAFFLALFLTAFKL